MERAQALIIGARFFQRDNLAYNIHNITPAFYLIDNILLTYSVQNDIPTNRKTVMAIDIFDKNMIFPFYLYITI